VQVKIPKRIKIAGHWVGVRRKRKVDKNEDSLGYAKYTHDEIELATSFLKKPIPESKCAEIFLHEIIHHVLDKYSVNMREKDVHLMSAGLFQVIRDNKLDFSK